MYIRLWEIHDGTTWRVTPIFNKIQVPKPPFTYWDLGKTISYANGKKTMKNVNLRKLSLSGKSIFSKFECSNFYNYNWKLYWNMCTYMYILAKCTFNWRQRSPGICIPVYVCLAPMEVISNKYLLLVTCWLKWNVAFKIWIHTRSSNMRWRCFRLNQPLVLSVHNVKIIMTT